MTEKLTTAVCMSSAAAGLCSARMLVQAGKNLTLAGDRSEDDPHAETLMQSDPFYSVAVGKDSKKASDI